MAQEEKYIEELFKEAFASHEVPVSPNVWAGIQSSIGSSSVSAGAAAGSSFLAKSMAVIGAAAVLTTATINEVNQFQKDSSTTSKTEQVIEMTQSSTLEKVEMEVANEETIEMASPKATDNVAQESASPAAIVEEAIEQEATSLEAEIDNALNVANALDHSTPKSASEKQTVASSKIDQTAKTIAPPSSAPETAKDEKTSNVGGSSNSDDQMMDESERIQSLSEGSENIEENEEPAESMARFDHDATQRITPNGDSYYDYFEVKGTNIKEFTIAIMNRSNGIVFESNDINFRWDGRDMSGAMLPTDAYYYHIRAIGNDGLPYTGKKAKGTIMLVRN